MGSSRMCLPRHRSERRGCWKHQCQSKESRNGGVQTHPENLEARDHQSIFYAIGSSIHMEVISRVPYTFQLTGDGC